MLITVAETLMTAFAGDSGRMKDAPRMLISQSLPRVIESATPEVTKQVTDLLYPGMLAVGLGAYVIDVYRALTAQQAAAREAKAKASAVLIPAQPVPAAADQQPSVTHTPAPAPELVMAAGGGNGNGLDDLASHDGRDFLAPRGF